MTADDDHYGTDISIQSCDADDGEYELKCTLRVASTFDWAGKLSRFNKDRINPKSIGFTFKFKKCTE